MRCCLLHNAYRLLVLAFVLPLSTIMAQSTRSSVNKGVDSYNEGKFIDSEVQFKKGLQKAPDSFQANFDLGDSYYKEGKYDESLRSYNEALSKASTDPLKAKVYHNVGNALLKDQKIKESIDAYTKSLKLNPNDEETKYNLSYALDLLKNQNQQNKNDKNNDKNKNDQKKNQDKKNQNQQNNQQNKNDQKNQQQNQRGQQPPPKISKDQAEAVFNALNNDEKNLQKQLRKMKGQPIKTDKDW